MLAVLAMELALDEVVDVALMRHRDVFAPDAVDVVVRVRAAQAERIAGPQVRRIELVLVDVTAVRVMQVAVVHVVDVIAVADRKVTAAGTVYVLVLVVNERFHTA
jgi:hypothetical protein